MYRSILVIVSLLLLSNYGYSFQDSKYEPDPEDFKVLKNATHFYVIGDWGRNGYENQQEVADMMQEMAKIIEPEFFISTGDNFYPNGIASIDDPYWLTSFESIYKGNYLFEEWYAILGNHDYRGNAQAQIDYSQKSQRWEMPDRYYSKEIAMVKPDRSIHLIFLDTSPLHDQYYEMEKYAAIRSQDTTKQIKWLDKTLESSDADWTIVVGHHPF